jgi:hypothetical protein
METNCTLMMNRAIYRRYRMHRRYMVHRRYRMHRRYMVHRRYRMHRRCRKYRRYRMHRRCRKYRRYRLNRFIRNMRYIWGLHSSCHELCLRLLSYLQSLLLPTKIPLLKSVISSCIHLFIQACIIINRRRTMSMQHMCNCISR